MIGKVNMHGYGYLVAFVVPCSDPKYESQH